MSAILKALLALPGLVLEFLKGWNERRIKKAGADEVKVEINEAEHEKDKVAGDVDNLSLDELMRLREKRNNRD